MFNRKIHYQWPFSIAMSAMLNSQREFQASNSPITIPVDSPGVSPSAGRSHRASSAIGGDENSTSTSILLALDASSAIAFPGAMQWGSFEKPSESGVDLTRLYRLLN